MIETEIQTAKDYGYNAGDRPDGLEQFKDALETGAEKMGLSSTIKAFNKTKKKFYKDVTKGASVASANRQAGVERND
jgi:hypothetical protein